MTAWKQWPTSCSKPPVLRDGALLAIKHALDRPFAVVGLLVMLPLLIAAAVAIKLSSPGPVLYRQRRVGRGGRAFVMLKLRSMRMPDGVTPAFRPLPGMAPGGVEGVDRRTAVGRVLRRTGFDELPQLVNVVRGEMSLVGPRPERPQYAELFVREHAGYERRQEVRPGLTGWAQVHGLRGQSSLADRLRWDNDYVQRWSLWLDLKILLLTMTAVVSDRGEARGSRVEAVRSGDARGVTAGAPDDAPRSASGSRRRAARSRPASGPLGTAGGPPLAPDDCEGQESGECGARLGARAAQMNVANDRRKRARRQRRV